MKNKKKELYIFLHIMKCAGTTLNEHIRNSLKENEVLPIYYGVEPPYISKKEEIEVYIKSLTKKQKDKLKVIFGHRVYYGLHKFFPNREVRYIIFLRNPIDRIISHYNYGRMRLKHWGEFHSNLPGKGIIKRYMENGKFRTFKEWFLRKDKRSEDYMFRFLFSRFFNKKLKDDDINEKNFKKMKKILNKFYFIGIVEKPEDFLFIYSKLGVRNFFPIQNISKKYFIPKDYKKTKKFVLTKNKYDLKLYNYVLKLNKRFKKRNKNFYHAVYFMNIKKLINLKLKLQLYKQSAKLKKYSKTYTKFVEIMKNGK